MEEKEELKFIYFRSNEIVNIIKEIKVGKHFTMDDYFDIYQCLDNLGDYYIYRLHYIGSKSKTTLCKKLLKIIPQFSLISDTKLPKMIKIKENKGIEHDNR